MALTTMDYTAYRALQRAIHDHLADVQWQGRFQHPRAIGWGDVGLALDEAIVALEAAGYRVVKAG